LGAGDARTLCPLQDYMALNKVTKRGIIGVPDWHGSSIYDFEEWLKNVSDKTSVSVFRGQRRYWPLLPRVIEGCKRGTVLEQEGELFSRFKADAGRCLHVIPKTDWDWLVVAQHHGLPTRLLDWSFDPFVALWFALENYLKPESEPEVWVLNPKKEDYVIPRTGMRPFQGARTKVFKPTFRIPRVREQKGCFTLFKYVKKSKSEFVPLEQNVRLRQRLQRFRVASYSCEKMRGWLEKKGYTHDRMYPDINEVAKQIKHEICMVA